MGELTAEAVWEMFRESAREADRRMKETDKRMKETDRQMKETDRKLRKLEELFTGQWGKLMESLVEGDLIPLLRARNIYVDTVLQRARKNLQNRDFEIDLIARNGQEVVFVEVKTTLKPTHVEDFLEKMRVIKTVFKEYRENTVYGAVAYLRSESNAHDFAMKNGLFVIRATGKSASIMNPVEFEPEKF